MNAVCNSKRRYMVWTEKGGDREQECGVVVCWLLRERGRVSVICVYRLFLYVMALEGGVWSTLFVFRGDIRLLLTWYLGLLLLLLPHVVDSSRPVKMAFVHPSKEMVSTTLYTLPLPAFLAFFVCIFCPSPFLCCILLLLWSRSFSALFCLLFLEFDVLRFFKWFV